MEVGTLVREHYGREGMVAALYAALADAGVDLDALSVTDLAPVDQLHAGFLPATMHVLGQLELGPATRLLDVGCGLGGPARVAAARYGCPVVGIDLSPAFVAAAQELTERTGLTALVQHQVADATHLDLPDASFDRAVLVHVGMNIEDKAAVFAEVHRVLRPGGVFALYEQMRTGPGEPAYPLPWADDARSSFVSTPEEYAAALTGAGFTVQRVEDRTPPGARGAASVVPPGGPDEARGGVGGDAGGGPPPLSPAVVFGPGFGERLAHNLAATRDGLLSPTLVLARAE